MASNHAAQLRADSFLLNRSLPQVAQLAEILKANVDEEVFQKVEQQINDYGYDRNSLKFWAALVRYLSRVSADEVWLDAVKTVLYATQEKEAKEVAANG